MKKQKQCAHTHAYYDMTWGNGRRVTVMGCYAIVRDDPHFGYGEDRVIFSARCVACGEWLSLGNSYDAPEAVQVEMRAADSIAAGAYICESHVWRNDDTGTFTITSADSSSDWYNAMLWPWDPMRPMAGQYEEWLRAAEAEADTPSRHMDGWTPHDDDGPGSLSPDPDDITIRAGAPEVIGLTPRQVRERTAAAVAAEDALRDPEVTARNAAVIANRPPIADLICHDDPGEPVDPATKFGELAQQMEASVSPGDALPRRTAGMVKEKP